jgi:ferredoxin-NADP reductase
MKLQLVEKKLELPDVESFILQPTKPLEWKAGQYIHYVLHHEPTDDRGSDRWFTISAAPVEEQIMITTRFNAEKSSSFKTKLKNLKIGKTIEMSVVDGDFIIDDFTKEYVFIAGGIGITPFRSILKQADAQGKQLHVTLLYSNRDENVLFKKELESFAKNNPHLQIQYIFSPEHIDETNIKKYITDLKNSYFYISGPEPMVENLGSLLKKMDIPEEHIKQDWFPGYPVE